MKHLKIRKFGFVKRRKSLQILNLTFNAVLFRMFPIHFTMHGVPCFCFNITPTFTIELDPKVPRKKVVLTNNNSNNVRYLYDNTRTYSIAKAI